MIRTPKTTPKTADINYYIPENQEIVVVHSHGRQVPHVHVLKRHSKCSQSQE